MKRSHAPVFWVLFGAGGMLSALFGIALVLVTGIAGPLGWLGAGALSYERVHAIAAHPLGALAWVALASLFAWHAAHRLLCTLHDFGVHKGLAAKTIAYGSAAVLTAIVASVLFGLR